MRNKCPAPYPGAGGRDTRFPCFFCHAAGGLAGGGRPAGERHAVILPARFFGGWMGGAGGRKGLFCKKAPFLPPATKKGPHAEKDDAGAGA